MEDFDKGFFALDIFRFFFSRQACSPLIQLFFGFASDIDQTNIRRDIRDGNWLSSFQDDEMTSKSQVSDRKGKKRRRESLFTNAQWSSGSRRRGSDVSEWPAWYHGWCRCLKIIELRENTHTNKDFIRRADVEALLKVGPDGLFLVKNSTEFPGDLTLCLFKVRIFAHCTN